MAASPGPSRSHQRSPAAADGAPVGNKHKLTPLEQQRRQVSRSLLLIQVGSSLTYGPAQLERLLKDPTKEVVIPGGPVEKELRPPREMMKNVQGSSAGVSGLQCPASQPSS